MVKKEVQHPILNSKTYLTVGLIASVVFTLAWSALVISTELPKTLIPNQAGPLMYTGTAVAYIPLFFASVAGWIMALGLLRLFKEKINISTVLVLGTSLGLITGFIIFWKVLEYFFYN